MSKEAELASQGQIHIVTSFAIRDGFDISPTEMAIQRACAMRRIKKIHVLSETQRVIAEKEIPFIKNEKIVYIELERRPTFTELIEYSNQIELEDNAAVSLMNSDISFLSEFDVEKSLHMLSLISGFGQCGILSITRHDIVDNQPRLTLYDNAGLPNLVSADCWFFKPPLYPVGLDYVNLGDMNCDSVIAFNLSEAGYCLVNPCLDVVVIHHEEVKGNDYYDVVNKKERSQSLLGWHWAKQCNMPYKTYGVPWIETSSAKAGYLPQPLIYQKKRIYLILDNSLSNSVAAAFFAVVEIISRINQRDLVVLYDLNFKYKSFLIDNFGSISRGFYFFPVHDIDHVVNGLMSEANWYGDSCALIGRLDYLTKNLVDEFHSVILDTRVLGDVPNITAPVGHGDIRAFAEARYQNINFNSIANFPSVFSDQLQCTLITSVFKSDEYIEGFKKNITSLYGYEQSPHIILFSKISDKELSVFNGWHSDCSNSILCWLKTDPGLYECWNIGIRSAQTDFVSNANVDDLRHPKHMEHLIDVILSENEVAIAATAVIPFEFYVDDINRIDISNPWYVHQAGMFYFHDLASINQDEEDQIKLVPNNIPHCMPVWKKTLHDTYGYFDELRYGTYADWAFWLKVMKGGEVGYLSKNPYTYYYINPTSHNRRGEKLLELHNKIENEFVADFYFRKKFLQNKKFIANDVLFGKSNVEKNTWPKKFFLEGLTQSFGQHRNSFNKIVETLRPLHDDSGGVLFIPFIERYFVWGTDVGEAASMDPKPILHDWVGILHVPFDAPKWFEYSVSPEKIFSSELWKKSLPYCRGIICLTEDLRRDLSYWYPNLPSLVVKHPTELNVKEFDFCAYEKKPRIIQAGDWLRRLQYIYEINSPAHEKIFLKKSNTDVWLSKEISVIGDLRNNTVNVLDYVSNEEYDNFLSNSVVVVWLYGSAANNIIIECISRKTPILINPLPSVVEYLGEDYPLYLSNREKAGLFLSDSCRIRAAYDYLKERSDLRACLSYDFFVQKIAESDFYHNL